MTSFHASGHTKEYERILFEKKRGEFNALEIWEDYPIIVPPLAPSNLPFCQIIRAQYIIRVKLHCILLLHIRKTNQFQPLKKIVFGGSRCAVLQLGRSTDYFNRKRSIAQYFPQLWRLGSCSSKQRAFFVSDTTPIRRSCNICDQQFRGGRTRSSESISRPS